MATSGPNLRTLRGPANVPLLVILGDFDHLVPPEDGRAAWERSGSEDKTLLLLDDFHHDVHWGHLDLVIRGSHWQQCVHISRRIPHIPSFAYILGLAGIA